MQSPRLQDLCNSVDWEHEMNKKEPLMKICSLTRDLGQYLISNLMEQSQSVSRRAADHMCRRAVYQLPVLSTATAAEKQIFK